MHNVPDLELSEEFYTTQALKHAVWQYLLDHTYGNMTDEIYVRLHIPSQQEFWRRVSGRAYGKYHAKDIKKQLELSDKKRKEYLSYLAHSKRSMLADEKFRALQTGSLKERFLFLFILFLRRLNKKLSPKI